MKATVRLVLPPVILLTDDNRGDREVLLRLNCANYFPPSLEASYIGFGRMEPQLHRLQRHSQKGRDTIGFGRMEPQLHRLQRHCQKGRDTIGFSRMEPQLHSLT